MVPLEVPFCTTDAPMMGSPVASLTVPLTMTSCARAERLAVDNAITSNAFFKCSILMSLIGYSVFKIPSAKLRIIDISQFNYLFIEYKICCM